jgi:hypothetical protein
MGNTILTGTGKALGLQPEHILFTLEFMHTTKQDFINYLKTLKGVSPKAGFPFLYINSDTVKYDGEGNVQIGELVIATLTDKNFYVGQRDAHVVKPILLTLASLLQDGIKSSFGVDYPFNPSMKVHYKGEMGDEGNTYPDFVDAITFSDIKLRILQNCNIKSR